MEKLFKKHKMMRIALISLVALILCIVYVYALFLPGVWHDDAFLYKKVDGEFYGSDMYAEYKMSIDKNKITFSVNGISKTYSIVENEGVEIFENGQSVFKGTVQKIGDFTILNDLDGKPIDVIKVTAGGVAPELSELYPDRTQLYNWYSMDKTDTRGEPYMLIVIAFIIVLLVVDIVFPDLFFYFKHGIMVDGGEPSDCYRAGQTFGRIVLVIAIVGCIIASFNMK